MAKRYYVYIMTNKYDRVLYTGVTNNLERRVYEHKMKLADGFTKKYNVSKLLWYGTTTDVNNAIAEEKKIKGWSRLKKIRLIEEMNPAWKDLSDGWSMPL